MNRTYLNLTEPADAATSLRMRMAQHRVSIDEVCQLVGRNQVTVSRWRTGHTSIPPRSARMLYEAGLLDAEALANVEATA